MKTTGSEVWLLSESKEIIRSKVRGNLRIKGIETTNPVAVGDEVFYTIEANATHASIDKVLPRRNYLIRRSVNLSHQAHIVAANLDKVFIVTTLAQPRTSLGFIDRMLVTCEAYHIPAVIIINKQDLWDSCQSEEAKNRQGLYASLGYPVVYTSAHTQLGLNAIKLWMQGGINLFTGHSGAGKSSLLNALAPHLGLKTGEISQVHHKGKHTTTFAEMFALPDQTYIIDTPGIKELALYNISPEELPGYFPEFRSLLSQCKYYNCRHVNEPECAVIKALERQEIYAERYVSYLSMLESDEMENRKRKNR